MIGKILIKSIRVDSNTDNYKIREVVIEGTLLNFSFDVSDLFKSTCYITNYVSINDEIILNIRNKIDNLLVEAKNELVSNDFILQLETLKTIGNPECVF